MLSKRGIISSLWRNLYHTLGGRVLASILLCSSLITLLTTGVQLYIEYRKDVQNTENIVQHTCESHLRAVAENLWSVDLRKIEQTLKQIVKSPDIQYMEIRDKTNILIRVGQMASKDVFVQTFPLVYQERMMKEHIGFLRVATSFDRIRQRLMSQVFVILGTQAVKTFLVSIFILIIFRYMVTRHLDNMAHYAKSLDMKKLDESLVLNRNVKLSRHPDELDLVVQALNQMRLSLLNSFSELESKNNELREMDRLKDQFLANTSHELKTPLNGIIGIVESMLEGALGPVSKNINYNLTLVQSCGWRLFHLVDDILDFSKLKNSDIRLNLTAVDISSVVSTVLKLIQPLVRDKPLELVNRIPAEAARVRADENRLFQILHNILGNAVKFTESGSVVIDAAEADGFQMVSISDTGIGISPENLETVFDSFERVDGDLNKQFPGVGLGLNISKKLIELHQGQIQIESEFGRGTTVSFRIPLADGNLQSVQQPSFAFQKQNPVISRFAVADSDRSPRIRPVATGKNFFKIMVVDDDLVVRQVLANYLTMEKFDICLAKDGETALEMLEKEKPDIVLLDIMMPGLNGFDVCETIRKTRSRGELPIILLSARNELKDRLQGMSVAASDYLEKPVFKHELLARIQNQLAILMANRRLNALLSLSEHIGKFKDVRELILFSFQLIETHIYANGAVLCQGGKIIRKSGGRKTLALIEKKVLPEYSTDDVLKVRQVSKPMRGQLVYYCVKGFEEYNICLFKKEINGDFQRSDLDFIDKIIREVQLIRSNILKITYKHNRRDEIQKITRNLNRILFIEASKSNCKVMLEGRDDPFEAGISMQEIDMYFGGYDLTRVHRKYFAALEKAESVQRKKSKDFDLIVGDFSIPIGRTYLKKVREKHAYLFC